MFDHLTELNRHAKFMRDGVTVRLDSALRGLPGLDQGRSTRESPSRESSISGAAIGGNPSVQVALAVLQLTMFARP